MLTTTLFNVKKSLKLAIDGQAKISVRKTNA